MSCSDFDVKGYLLGELAAADRERVAGHLAGCQQCREELERLQVTRAALLSVRDEEIPKRIAFVSDKIFEPNWWQRFWRSGPRLGFASAAMLSLAILVHAFWQPAPAPRASLDQAVVEQVVKKEVASRVEAAVREAVAASERRQAEQTARLLAAAEKRYEMERREDLLTVQENFEVLRKRMNVMYLASAYRGGE